jgi:hypothetical protein
MMHTMADDGYIDLSPWVGAFAFQAFPVDCTMCSTLILASVSLVSALVIPDKDIIAELRSQGQSLCSDHDGGIHDQGLDASSWWAMVESLEGRSSERANMGTGLEMMNVLDMEIGLEMTRTMEMETGPVKAIIIDTYGEQD